MYYHTNNFVYIIFMIIGFTCDYLDGYLSRSLDLKSDIGNILDKIVDKINQSMLLLVLTTKFKVSKMYLLFYFIREIVMLVLRKFKFRSKFSSIHGKLKTSIFPIVLVLFHNNNILKNIYLNCWSVYNIATLCI